MKKEIRLRPLDPIPRLDLWRYSRFALKLRNRLPNDRKPVVSAGKKKGKFASIKEDTRGLLARKSSYDSEVDKLGAIVQRFAEPTFSAALFLQEEIENQEGLGASQEIQSRLQEYYKSTSATLKKYISEYYPNFVQCSRQITGIEGDMANTWKILRQFQKILLYQNDLHFEIDPLQQRASVSHTMDTAPRHQKVPDLPENSDNPFGILDDVRIYLQEKKWYESISLLNMLEKKVESGGYDHLGSRNVQSLQKRIHRMKHTLFTQCSRQLKNHRIKRFDRRRLTTYILKLGESFHVAGISIYLNCKGQEMHHHIRRIRLRGDLRHYIVDLSRVVFQSIRDTLFEFEGILQDSNIESKNDYSSFVVWVITQMDNYINYFKTQVFLSQTPLSKIGECMRICFGTFSKLEVSGISIWMHLKKQLEPTVKTYIKRYNDRQIDVVNDAILCDGWNSISLHLSTHTFESNASHVTRRHGYQEPQSHRNSIVGIRESQQSLINEEEIRRLREMNTATLAKPNLRNRTLSTMDPQRPESNSDSGNTTDDESSSSRVMHDRTAFTDSTGSIRGTGSSSIPFQYTDESNGPTQEIELLGSEQPSFNHSSSQSQRKSSEFLDIPGSIRNSGANLSLKPPQTLKRRKSMNFEMHKIPKASAAKEQHSVVSTNGQNVVLLKLTPSAMFVYESMREYLSEVRYLFSSTYYPWMCRSLFPVIVLSVIRVLEKYCGKLTDIIRSCKFRPSTRSSLVSDEKGKESPSKGKGKGNRKEIVLTFEQRVAMTANVYFLCEDLLVRISRRLCKQFHLDRISDFDPFQMKLRKLYNAQMKYMAKKYVLIWVQEDIGFGNINDMGVPPQYQISANEEDLDLEVSTEFMQLLETWSEMIESIGKCWSPKMVLPMMNKIVDEFIAVLIKPSYAEMPFTNYGYKLIILDLSFFMKCAKVFIPFGMKIKCQNIVTTIQAILTQREQPFKQSEIDRIISETLKAKPSLDFTKCLSH